MKAPVALGGRWRRWRRRRRRRRRRKERGTELVFRNFK
jgi:hypothetical protein